MLTNREILEKLRSEVCEIVFEKKDGSHRHMVCTLMEDFLPVTNGTSSGNSEDKDLITVFDLEENSWRAFKPSKLLSIEFSKE